MDSEHFQGNPHSGDRCTDDQRTAWKQPESDARVATDSDDPLTLILPFFRWHTYRKTKLKSNANDTIKVQTGVW